jgi:hypothetical protein
MMEPPEVLAIKRMKQQDIRKHDCFTQLKTEEALCCQTDFFVYDMVPLQLADSPYLRAWLEAFIKGTGEIASRKQLAIRVHARAEEVKGRVIGKLRACRGVTVGVDGWTNVRHDKVINLCPVGRSVAYYWDSVVLKRGATAEEQAGPIADGIRSIVKAGILVVGIVTDNEAVNGAIHRRLIGEFPFLIHIPCAAHTLQLCVRKAMKLDPISPCVKALLALLLAFKHSKDLRVMLKDQQGVMRRNQQPLQLITVVPTRWNSVLFAANRVLLLKESLLACIPSIRAQLTKEKKRDHYVDYTYSEDSFWRPLTTLVDFLTPYKAATDVIQSDDASLGDVHYQFAALMNRAHAFDPPYALASIKHELVTIMKDQWSKHVNLNAVVLCSLFTFDTAYTSFAEQERVDADDWFCEWGTAFVKHYSLSTHDDVNAISRALEFQRSQFLSREGLFSTLDDRRVKLGTGRRNARTLWGGYLGTVQEMAACVLALLELTASEAAVERSFSRQGQLHSKARNRLADESVHVHMSFSFNSRALSKADALQSSADEEQELEVDEDMSNGTALLSQHYLADEEILPAGPLEDEEADEDIEDEVEDEVEDRRDDGKEEKEERGAEEEKSWDERCHEVVINFCERACVTQGFKWNGPREQLLESLTIERGLHVLTDDMKKRVKAHMAAL